MQYELRIAGTHYDLLKKHLFPGDGLEAVAVVLCGRLVLPGRHILLSHAVHVIPHDQCERRVDRVNWRTDDLGPLLERAMKEDLAVLKIHSHPSGCEQFSSLDDRSDADLFASAFGWNENGVHASAVMLPNDSGVFGRAFHPDLTSTPFSKVSVAGKALQIWKEMQTSIDKLGFSLRTAQAFGEGTQSKLRGLRVGVVGCSGTGSPTIEQLYRLGVGELVLVDPDHIEEKNLNRIINSTHADALVSTAKTTLFARTIALGGFPTVVECFDKNLYESKEALRALSSCDVVFGCMDSIDGRHVLNQLANFYLVPYFDMGVKLIADGGGGIESISGVVHYLEPGRSSLMSRKVYTPEGLLASGLRREDPKEHEIRLAQKYVVNVDVPSPAVISVNMFFSAFAINEFLDRLHRVKNPGTGPFAKITFDLSNHLIQNETEEEFDQDFLLKRYMGRGDHSPYLNMPELGS